MTQVTSYFKPDSALAKVLEILKTAGGTVDSVVEMTSYHTDIDADFSVVDTRLRALLRRSNGRAEPLINLRGVVLDPQSQQVTLEGKPVSLSRKEFILLHELMAQPDRVLTRDRLEQALYGWNEDVDSNTLEVHIHHLRRKLFSGLIRTLRGVGYMIERQA